MTAGYEKGFGPRAEILLVIFAEMLCLGQRGAFVSRKNMCVLVGVKSGGRGENKRVNASAMEERNLRRVKVAPPSLAVHRPDALPASYQGRSMGLNSDIRGKEKKKGGELCVKETRQMVFFFLSFFLSSLSTHALRKTDEGEQPKEKYSSKYPIDCDGC